jgi:hypothetical protein
MLSKMSTFFQSHFSPMSRRTLFQRERHVREMKEKEQQYQHGVEALTKEQSILNQQIETVLSTCRELKMMYEQLLIDQKSDLMAIKCLKKRLKKKHTNK